MDKNNYALSSDDKEIIEYYYQRNLQLYELLKNGMLFSNASELFGLTKNSIKTMWKEHRHKFNKQLATGV